MEENPGAEDGMRSFVQERFFLLCHLLTSGLISRVRPRGCSWVRKLLIQAKSISSASVGTSTGLAWVVGFHAVRYPWFGPTACSAVPTPCLPLFSTTSQTLYSLSWGAPPSCHSGLLSEQMRAERKTKPTSTMRKLPPLLSTSHTQLLATQWYKCNLTATTAAGRIQ